LSARFYKAAFIALSACFKNGTFRFAVGRKKPGAISKTILPMQSLAFAAAFPAAGLAYFSPMAANTHLTVKELLDVSFSV
jgi:hypothetical protein